LLGEIGSTCRSPCPSAASIVGHGSFAQQVKVGAGRFRFCPRWRRCSWVATRLDRDLLDSVIESRRLSSSC
jgi:hypothetical protein